MSSILWVIIAMLTAALLTGLFLFVKEVLLEDAKIAESMKKAIPSKTELMSKYGRFCSNCEHEKNREKWVLQRGFFLSLPITVQRERKPC